jgi:hypothetical protein
LRLNVYDTFEDEVELMKMAKKLQEEGMESLKQPHLWVSEPIKVITPNSMKKSII